METMKDRVVGFFLCLLLPALPPAPTPSSIPSSCMGPRGGGKDPHPPISLFSLSSFPPLPLLAHPGPNTAVVPSALECLETPCFLQIW